MTLCLACRRKNCKQCQNDFCECSHSWGESDRLENTTSETNRKNDYDLKDPQSTGRKRAARLFPLDAQRPCEFAGCRDVGSPGFEIPGIDGCGTRPGTNVGTQQARHHVDYNTLNNDSDNVVRICHSCHVQLHHVIDPLKDEFYEKKYGQAAARGLERTYKKLRKENDGAT